MKKIIIIAILAAVPFLLFAQTDSVGRFSVSLSAGMAFPIGSYSSMDADKSAL